MILKNTAHHPKFRFVSWWTIRNQNIRGMNNATKNDENLILHEEPFLNSHEQLLYLFSRQMLFNNSTIRVNKYHPRRAFNLYPTRGLNFSAKKLNNYPPKRLISQVSSYQAYVMDKHCFTPIVDSCSRVAVIRRKYRFKS